LVRTPLIAGTILLFAARLVLSLVRSGPVLVADEMGYLTNARVLAGGLEGQLEQAPFYRGGYSLLIAPLLELASDPGVAYHLVLVLNAALAASVFPLLYLLLTRMAAVPSRIAIWAALAGACYPAITVLSQVAMSENAMFALICVWLIAVGGLLGARDRRASLTWAGALGASTAALWVVHNRMITVVALTAALVLWHGVRRRIDPAAAVIALVIIAAGAWATHLLDDFLIDASYGGEARGEGSDRLSDLFDGHGPLTAAANLAGQTWYLFVSTFGLTAVVVAGAVTHLRRRVAGAGVLIAPIVAILLALTALLLAISAAAFPVRTRPDMLVYGRYVEIVAPPLIAFGLAAISRTALPPKLLRSLAAALVLLTAATVLISVTSDDPGTPNRWNIAALPFVTAQLGPAILIGAASVAAAGGWLLARAAGRQPKVVCAAALALFIPVLAYGVWNPVVKSEGDVYVGDWTSPEPVADAYDIRSVAYDLDHEDVIGLYAIQWFLPDTAVTLFSGRRRPPPSRYFISVGDWPTRHPRAGAVELWRFEGRDQVLWRLGSS
jgi:hypothetical protein